VVWLEEYIPPVVDLGALCDFIFLISSGMTAASIVGGMRFPSVHQLTVATCQYRCCTALYWALLVQVTAPTSHAMGRFLAVSPDMTNFLAVVTLCEASLSFVRRYPDCNMVKASQFEYIVGF
jgi:hypothetical protein